MRYTVLLLRPDYTTADYGEDTYMAHVEADGVPAAIEVAQLEAVECDFEGIYDEGADPDDFPSVRLGHYLPLLVIEGHHNDARRG